jgi:hypothetical protein
MSSGGDETLATYHYEDKNVDVVGHWYEKNGEYEYAFYDLFLVNTGECINEGYYLFAFPSYQQVKKFLEEGFTGEKK